MQKYEVKILLIFVTSRKILFICPICRENNSIMIDNEDIRLKLIIAVIVVDKST